MSDQLLPFGSDTKKAIEAGDLDALIRAVICLAESWGRTANISVFCDGFAFLSISQKDPRLAGLVAAAIDLSQLMVLSPQGREAVQKLGLKPLFKDSKSE